MQTVNGLDEARAALHAGARELQSPDFAACHAGVNYYQTLLTQLCTDFPDCPFTFTLCCGDDPAIAHDALRMGFTSIRIRCTDGMFAQLEQMAKMEGARVLRNA